MTIVRVFPRRTKATPTDQLSFVSEPDLIAFGQDIREVRVSVAFTYDIPKAERLAEAWRGITQNVKIGGPAYNDPGGEFEPGLYLRDGYTITSRGCPNRCWFCAVWKREDGKVRELIIRDGWNVLDDNLLACSENHIRAVFAMLKRQKQKAEFTGGLEAARLQPWHIDLLTELKPRRIYFAYDTPDDYEPLRQAAGWLREAGIRSTSHIASAYCLIGWPKDTMDAAERRLRQTLELGITPFAMLWRDRHGRTDETWRKFQRQWARPAIIYGMVI